MADIFTKSKRSEVMARIKGGGNKDTELALIKLFRRQKITGWRRKHKLFGKPDFAFPKLGLAVFVDGCFWHACPKHSNTPASNRNFWRKKLSENQKRDRFVTRTLKQNGWRVMRIWEHELTRKNAARLMRKLERGIGSPKFAQ